MNTQIETTTNATSDVILTREEAAKHIKVSVRTIDEWRTKRLIPAIQIGRSVRFSLLALSDCLAQSTIPTTATKTNNDCHEAN